MGDMVLTYLYFYDMLYFAAINKQRRLKYKLQSFVLILGLSSIKENKSSNFCFKRDLIDLEPDLTRI